MAKKPGWREKLLLSLKRVRFSLAALLAVVFYGAGFAVPMLGHMPTASLVLYVLSGSLLAFIVVFGWLVVRLEDVERRHLVNWTSSIRNLDAREFEHFVGEIFRREGFAVEETGKHGEPDGNVDLILKKKDKSYIVQCKRWQARDVGVDEIRQFAGTLLRNGLTGPAGMYVTLSRFTDAARREASDIGISLVDGTELERRWDKVRQIEPCPNCGKAMIVARSEWGWWLRCRAQGCSGKRDLSRDAGRAVELLTVW